jgi:hypothetical protein
VGAKSGSELAQWESVLVRVQAYLSAWRIGDREWAADCAQEIVASARKRGEGDPVSAALAEADLFLQRWFQQFSAGTAEAHAAEGEVGIEKRLALLAGAPADANFADRVQLAAAFRHGALNMDAALKPARHPETRAITMQTSLSRLPSIRIIAGWLLLIALLFLAFVLTHHHLLP